MGRGDDALGAKLTDQLTVGAVSNMREIVQRTMRASKVITI